MDAFLKSLLEGSSGWGAYGLVFGILTACGLGLPLPEDISLILGGFLAHKGAARVEWMMVTGLLGILAGDSLIFYAGRRWGSRVGKGQGFFARIVTPDKRARVEGLFKQHGEKIVMIARFMPGVRAVTYFTAGSVGMKYSHFILWDGIAALASAPAFVYLGYHFGGELDSLINSLKQGQMGVFGVLGLVAVAYFGLKILRKRRKAKQEAAQGGGVASPLVSAGPVPVPVVVTELPSGRSPERLAAEASVDVVAAGRPVDRNHG